MSVNFPSLWRRKHRGLWSLPVLLLSAHRTSGPGGSFLPCSTHITLFRHSITSSRYLPISRRLARKRLPGGPALKLLSLSFLSQLLCPNCVIALFPAGLASELLSWSSPSHLLSPSGEYKLLPPSIVSKLLLLGLTSSHGSLRCFGSALILEGQQESTPRFH